MISGKERSFQDGGAWTIDISLQIYQNENSKLSVFMSFKLTKYLDNLKEEK